jgi:hypothetical protein
VQGHVALQTRVKKHRQLQFGLKGFAASRLSHGHMTPCACHRAACRAAGHGNTCVVLRIGLLHLFDDKADIVDLVLRHYYHGASGWDTARLDGNILSVQYGPAGDVIAAGGKDGRIHLICAQTGAKFLCLKGHR